MSTITRETLKAICESIGGLFDEFDRRSSDDWDLLGDWDLNVLRDEWIGGVADFGDPRAAVAMARLPQYDEYREEVQNLVREHLGDSFTVWRLTSVDTFESWHAGEDLPPMGTTLSRSFAENFAGFAGFDQEENPGEKVILEIKATPKAVLFIGHPQEKELVIDPNEISASAVSVYKTLTQSEPQQPEP